MCLIKHVHTSTLTNAVCLLPPESYPWLLQNYLKAEGPQHWKGSLYVFDGRMAIPGDLSGGCFCEKIWWVGGIMIC